MEVAFTISSRSSLYLAKETQHHIPLHCLLFSTKLKYVFPVNIYIITYKLNSILSVHPEHHYGKRKFVINNYITSIVNHDSKVILFPI